MAPDKSLAQKVGTNLGTKLRWIWRGFVATSLLLGGSAFWGIWQPTDLGPSSQTAWDPSLFNDPIFLLFSFLAFTDLSLGLVLPRILVKPGTPMPANYSIIQWALFEGCTLFGVLLAFIRKDPSLCVPFVALSIGALLKYRPKESGEA